jgi:hypothetical protein
VNARAQHAESLEGLCKAVTTRVPYMLQLACTRESPAQCSLAVSTYTHTHTRVAHAHDDAEHVCALSGNERDSPEPRIRSR